MSMSTVSAAKVILRLSSLHEAFKFRLLVTDSRLNLTNAPLQVPISHDLLPPFVLLEEKSKFQALVTELLVVIDEMNSLGKCFHLARGLHAGSGSSSTILHLSHCPVCISYFKRDRCERKAL